MKLNKYIHIRDSKTEKQQLIPLYSQKDDVGKPSLNIVDDGDVVYAKLLKEDGPLASKLKVRSRSSVYMAEKLDEKDTLKLTRFQYTMKYNPELHDSFVQKADELVSEMLSAKSSKERTALSVARGRYQHLAKITDFQNAVYKKDHAAIPNPVDTSALDDTSYMFYGCKKLENVQELDLSHVMDMRSMFAGCKSLPSIFPWYIDASKMDEIEKYRDMFKGSSVNTAYFKNVPKGIQDILPESADIIGLYAAAYVKVPLTQDKYKMKDLYPDTYRTEGSFDGPFGVLGMTSVAEMYDGCEGLTTPTAFNTSFISSFERMFQGCKSLPEEFPYTIDVSGIKSCEALRGMFTGTPVKSVRFRTMNPQSVYRISEGLVGDGVDIKATVIMSGKKYRLKELFPETYRSMTESCQHPNDLLEVDLVPRGSVEDASFMFDGCSSLMTVNSERLLGFHGFKNVAAMFQDCESLEEMPAIDTSKAEDLSYMFSGCLSLSAPVPLETKSAKNVSYMFSDCQGLEGEYPFIFDVGNVKQKEGLAQMFGGTSVQKVSLLNVDVAVRNQMDPSWLGDSVEEICYYTSVDWMAKDYAMRKLGMHDAVVIRNTEHALSEIEGAEEISELLFMNIEDASHVIGPCKKLSTIGKLTGTGRIKNMAGMFSGCRSLMSLPPVNIEGIKDASALEGFVRGTFVKQVTLLNASDEVKAALTPEILGNKEIKILYA